MSAPFRPDAFETDPKPTLKTKVQIYAASANAAFADRLAQALDRDGCRVVNGDFDVSGAEAVIVVWSGASIGSRALIAAARRPLERRALIPVSIGRIEPPEGFRDLAPVDLAGWTGDSHDPRWRFVLDDIARAGSARAIDPAAADALPAPPAPLREKLQDAAPVLPPAPTAALIPPAPTHASVRPAPPDGAAAPVLASRADPSPQTAPRRFPARVAAAAGVAAVVLALGAALIGRDENPKATEAPSLSPTASLEAKVVGAAVADAPAPMIGVIAPIDEAPSALQSVDPGPAPIAPEAARADAAPPIAETAGSAAPGDQSGSAAPETADLETPQEPADGIAALIAANTATPAQSNALPTDELTQPPSPRDVARAGDAFKDCDACPELAAIPAGAFKMGTPAGETARRRDEGPVTDVTIAKPFALARSETTVAEWNKCVADKVCPPSPQGGGSNRPVVNVSFQDAQTYARWLSEKSGKTYRLPSEAEWEYAARAGAETPFPSGSLISPKEASFNASISFDADRARKGPRPAASYAPNAFGLYDMNGNVWEWTADCWKPTHAGAPSDGSARGGRCASRVLKGGAWNTGRWRLRAGHRIGKPAGAREHDNGFRVARDLE